jgi:hypothetical protein
VSLVPGRSPRRVAELREIAGGRPDLLAEQAGLLLGYREGAIDEAHARAAVLFLIRAGADEALIPAWAMEGRRRAAEAARLPFGSR